MRHSSFSQLCGLMEVALVVVKMITKCLISSTECLDLWLKLNSLKVVSAMITTGTLNKTNGLYGMARYPNMNTLSNPFLVKFSYQLSTQPD